MQLYGLYNIYHKASYHGERQRLYIEIQVSDMYIIKNGNSPPYISTVDKA
jgi:hypothetical protein